MGTCLDQASHYRFLSPRSAIPGDRIAFAYNAGAPDLAAIDGMVAKQRYGFLSRMRIHRYEGTIGARPSLLLEKPLPSNLTETMGRSNPNLVSLVEHEAADEEDCPKNQGRFSPRTEYCLPSERNHHPALGATVSEPIAKSG